MLVWGMVLMLVLAMHTQTDRWKIGDGYLLQRQRQTPTESVSPTSIIIMKESRPTIPLQRRRARPRVRHVDIILCIWRLETEQPAHWLVVIMCPCTPVFDC
jgi:hypothetical protein